MIWIRLSLGWSAEILGCMTHTWTVLSFIYTSESTIGKLNCSIFIYHPSCLLSVS